MIETPPGLDPSIIEGLAIRLKAGDKEAQQQLITGYIGVSQRIAYNWYKRIKGVSYHQKMTISDGENNKNYYLDLFESEALYHMLLAIEKAKTKLIDNNIEAFIVKYVSINLLKFCYQNHLFKKRPRKSLRLKNRPLLVTLRKIDLAAYSEDDSDLTVDLKEIHRRGLDEMLAIIDEVVKTPEEERVFQLKLMAYTSEEISGIMSIPAFQVRRIFRGLCKKVQREE